MGSVRRVGLIIVAAGLAVGGALGLLGRGSGPLIPQQSTASTSAAALISVHVGGWVMSPGVFEVPDGSIVADAIKAAGGLRPGAMADAVNLAAPVVAGQQIIVTGPGTVAQPSHEGGDTRVSLNSATVAELDSLPGVGPVLAERIVEFREEHGLFTTVEDLLEVSGIGEAKLASIRDLVTVP